MVGGANLELMKTEKELHWHIRMEESAFYKEQIDRLLS